MLTTDCAQYSTASRSPSLPPTARQSSMWTVSAPPRTLSFTAYLPPSLPSNSSFSTDLESCVLAGCQEDLSNSENLAQSFCNIASSSVSLSFTSASLTSASSAASSSASRSGSSASGSSTSTSSASNGAARMIASPVGGSGGAVALGVTVLGAVVGAMLL